MIAMKMDSDLETNQLNFFITESAPHICTFYPFSPSVHINTIENGGFQKLSPEWRFLKMEVPRISVDG